MDVKYAEMVEMFLADRPDMAGCVTHDADNGAMIRADALPAFALWAVQKGYANGDAFDKAFDLQRRLEAAFS